MGCKNICPVGETDHEKHKAGNISFPHSELSLVKSGNQLIVDDNSNYHEKQFSVLSTYELKSDKEISEFLQFGVSIPHQHELTADIINNGVLTGFVDVSTIVKIFRSNSNNEIIYEGYVNRNYLPNGCGIYSSRFLKYEGNFQNGLRHGKGIFKIINIDKELEYLYEGDWENDYKNGQGEEFIKNLSTYKGSFKNGLKEGNGLLTLDSGKYEGEFKANQLHGKGNFIWTNGNYFEGEWNDSSITGYGVLKSKSRIHKGYFALNKKEGLGISFYTNREQAIVGRWEKDRLKGVFIKYVFVSEVGGSKMTEIIAEVGSDKSENKTRQLNYNEAEIFKSTKEYLDLVSFFNH